MPEFTLTIRYSVVGRVPHQGVRRIPWRWYPSQREIVDAVRRLRSQIPDVNVTRCDLHKTELIETIDIGEDVI